MRYSASPTSGPARENFGPRSWLPPFEALTVKARCFNHSSLIRAGRINPCQIYYVLRPSPFSRPLLSLSFRSLAPGSVRRSRLIASVDSSGIRLPTPARRLSRRKTVRPVSTGTRCPMCAVRWVSSSPPKLNRSVADTTTDHMSPTTGRSFGSNSNLRGGASTGLPGISGIIINTRSANVPSPDPDNASSSQWTKLAIAAGVRRTEPPSSSCVPLMDADEHEVGAPAAVGRSTNQVTSWFTVVALLPGAGAGAVPKRTAMLLPR